MWRVLVTQLCSTLCDPMDCGLPGSSIHGISQARVLEWFAISYSSRYSWPRNWTFLGLLHWGQILYRLSWSYVFMMIKIKDCSQNMCPDFREQTHILALPVMRWVIQESFRFSSVSRWWRWLAQRTEVQSHEMRRSTQQKAQWGLIIFVATTCPHS